MIKCKSKSLDKLDCDLKEGHKGFHEHKQTTLWMNAEVYKGKPIMKFRGFRLTKKQSTP